MAFAFGVDQLRRLPGARIVARWLPLVTRALFLMAGILLVVWMAEKTPQRIGLADLAAGKLSPMQSWIIVSGELTDGPPTLPGFYSYRLTDLSVPGPSMLVRSPVTLPLGTATISGYLEGGRDTTSGNGFPWVGSMEANPSLASEIPPPWAAAAVAAVGLLILAARRTSYPMFFRDRPHLSAPAIGATRADIYRSSVLPIRAPVTGAIVIDQSNTAAASLRLPGTSDLPIRLHSSFTGVIGGDFRELRVSRPALRWRQPAEDLVLSFSSVAARDAVYAALVAAEQQSGRAPSESATLASISVGGERGR